MALSTVTANEHTLRIQNNPDLFTYAIGFVVVIMPSVMVFGYEKTRYLTAYFVMTTLFALIGALGFGVLKIDCEVNMQTRKIRLIQISLFKLLTRTSEQEFDLNDLHSIKMVQYPNRQRSPYSKDKFGIQLSLQGQSFQIAGGELGFEECQYHANQIQRFVGSHIPILTVG